MTLTFVPVALGWSSQCILEDVQLCSHWLDAPPKERNLGALQHITSLETKFQQNKMHRNGVCNQFQSCTENPAPVVQIWADHDCLITISEKQNEIISMLVEHQSLLHLLPKLRFLMGIPYDFRLLWGPEHSIEANTQCKGLLVLSWAVH